jgi:glycosyltransferase involved in cell wall biosynthesis
MERSLLRTVSKSLIDDITPMIITYNEAPNIERVLDQLTWANRIVVIDSYSTDETLEILSHYPQVHLVQRKFDSFALQCNFGLAQIDTEWVLSLDADYVLTDELIREIQTLVVETRINSYQIQFKYCIFGKPLRGTLLPPRTMLYRRQKALYRNDGHAHRVDVEGETRLLRHYIYHDDRKSLSRWLWAQDRYMGQEVKKLLSTPEDELSLSDRIRKLKILAPIIIFFYCLILKGGILDGWAGWYYAFQRTLAEILLSIHLIQTEYLES